MALYKQALHFLAAASFVFVNLVCPCVPANASQVLPTDSVAAHAEAAAANCHEQPVVDPRPPHQECPECSSVVAINCEEQAPVVPGAPVNLVPDGSNEHSAAGTVEAALPLPLFTPALASVILPDGQWVDLTDSPVRRHDLLLE